jgi:hypothetical protein
MTEEYKPKVTDPLDNISYDKLLNGIKKLNSIDIEMIQQDIKFVTGPGDCPFMQSKILKRTRCGHCAKIKEPFQFYLARKPQILYDITPCLANYQNWTDCQKAQYQEGLQDMIDMDAEKAKRGKP